MASMDISTIDFSACSVDFSALTSADFAFIAEAIQSNPEVQKMNAFMAEKSAKMRKNR